MQLPLPDHSVLVQDHTFAQPGRWLLFTHPVKVVQALTPDAVPQALEAVEQAVAGGLHAAGYLAYEAAAGLDKAMRVHGRGTGMPLLWFGLYPGCEPLDALPPAEPGDLFPGPWEPSVTADEYHRAIDTIRQRIGDGDTYQVNHTFRLRNRFEGDPWALFLRLQSAQQGRYGAFIRTGRHSICSASPELFFALQDGRITCKPMKGTAPRGPTNQDDRQRAQWLLHSEKNRAENLMIVDMIRNDLGAMAEVGSVKVEALFTIEKYPTVHQMTSTVTARSRAGALRILARMFPCASITGAPKVKTMEIIAGLESSPRGVYTGSIGHVSPRGTAQFNVAIRTVVVDHENKTAEYGVGGGIVWDSAAAEEYEECRAKAAVLFAQPQTFGLFETLLWEPGSGLYLVEEHLDRLLDSAAYHGIPAAREALRALLQAYRPSADAAQRGGLRLVLSREGQARLEPFDPVPVKGRRVAFASQALPPAQPPLFHKTTDRRLYNDLKARHPNLQDVLLWTADGHVTESTIANVVLRLDGQLYTPLASHGLLPGVFRRRLLEAGVVREAALRKEDVLRAEALYLVNSLRGWMRLDPEAPGEPAWRIATEFEYGLQPPGFTR